MSRTTALRSACDKGERAAGFVDIQGDGDGFARRFAATGRKGRSRRARGAGRAYPEQVRHGGEALLAQLTGNGQDGPQAAAGAAAATGLPLDKLEALLPALASHLGEGGIEGLLGRLGGQGGLLSAFDKDGDGNPINDLTGMAKGLFG